MCLQLIIFFIILILLIFYRKLLLSLFIIIFFIIFLKENYSFSVSIVIFFKYFYKNLELHYIFSSYNIYNIYKVYNLYICMFLLLLGVFISLLKETGIIYGYSEFLKKIIKTDYSASIFSLILSKLMIIDDYLSNLFVGSIVYPISKKVSLSKVRLSFLVDSMSSPLVALCPISSWSAAMLGFFKKNGIFLCENGCVLSVNPIELYIKIIPFILYSFVLLFGIWIIVVFKIRFFKCEIVLPIKNTINSNYNSSDNKKYFFIFIFFMVFFIVSVFFYVFLTGGYFFLIQDKSLSYFFQNCHITLSLFLGILTTLFFSIVYFLLFKYIILYNILYIFINGVKLMLPSVFLLICSWILGDLLQEFSFLYNLSDFILKYINIIYIPSFLFLFSFFVSFITGSSWGTAGLLFPILISLLFNDATILPLNIDNIAPIVYPSFGAFFSGCIAGDHLSPISDTTIMSATSSNCPYLVHFYTQFVYCLPFLIIVFILYVICSFFVYSGIYISLYASFVFLLLFFWIYFKIVINYSY